ncbi:hypothetical protein EVAR_58086_1 [Eumeta japonica]|uniref:Uncharacterized protein n=1 Tax=Eumeta variegata TaxID=151549 RepID=A0A4C1Z9T6_EUMVA|nr:hypothetical protein EVAR_58086_1 [Eumeta japonica]
MFEQIGNFTKNNLTHNTKHVKEKENKSNHVAAACGGNQNPSPNKVGQPPAPLKKPFKLRNIASKAESYDTLYGNGTLTIDIIARVGLSHRGREASFSFRCEPGGNVTLFCPLSGTKSHIFNENLSCIVQGVWPLIVLCPRDNSLSLLPLITVFLALARVLHVFDHLHSRRRSLQASASVHKTSKADVAPPARGPPRRQVCSLCPSPEKNWSEQAKPITIAHCVSIH